jgi:hypothetical protein
MFSLCAFLLHPWWIEDRAKCLKAFRCRWQRVLLQHSLPNPNENEIFDGQAYIIDAIRCDQLLCFEHGKFRAMLFHVNASWRKDNFESDHICTTISDFNEANRLAIHISYDFKLFQCSMVIARMRKSDNYLNSPYWWQLTIPVVDCS